MSIDNLYKKIYDIENEQEFANRRIQISILKQRNKKIIDLTKPVEIKTYLAVSVLGKSLNLNIIYKKINVQELDIEDKKVNIILPNKYKNMETVDIISKEIKKVYDELVEIEIANSMEKIRVILGFAPEDYKIKRMNDTFIKNNREKVITINPDITKFSKKIIENSLIQAFCKTKYKENTKEYKNLLKKAIEKYEKYEYRIIKVS